MLTKGKEEIRINKSIKQTERYMKRNVGVGTSFDVEYRKLIILKRQIQIYYVNGLIDDITVNELVKKVIDINDDESNRKKLYEIIENRLVNLSVTPIKTMDEAVDQILSGIIVLFMDGESSAFAVDVRQYPGRTPEEPDTERVVRGSRDGFTENVIQNTALVRRRIRDSRLRNEMLGVGERGKTDVCLSYIKDIANDDIVKVVRERVQKIEVDGITMADKAVEEFILEDSWNPYPLVRYTERPDVAANHLLEGHVLLTVDTSPSVIILPTTFFDHLEHAEEYRQAPAIGTFIRWIRMLAVMASLYLLPLWLLFVLEPSLLPKSLSFIGPEEVGNIPIFIQILLADIGVEFLRMAAIHTPTALATAMGLIAAVLIGEIAVDVGMFSPEVILYVSVSTIGNYVTPSYELSVANKIIKTSLIILTAIFGLTGFVVGITVQILYLAQLKSLHTPYFWPFLPFNMNGFYQTFIRLPEPSAKQRPSIVHPKQRFRQPLDK